MSRAKVAICALVAMFMLGALAAPALAKKEFKREFTASGPEAKLEAQTAGTGGYQFIFAFEEKGKGFAPKKVKCTELSKGTGEIKTTEGVATSFLDKVTFGGCHAEKKKFEHEVKIPAMRIGIPRKRHGVDSQRSQNPL